MIELDRSVTVRRPLSELVGYFADFANTEQWDPGTKTCSRIGDGPVEVGARWQNVSEFRGKETELEYTLDRQEPARVTFTGRNKTVTSTDDISFEPDGAGTRISYRAAFEFHGLAKLAQPLLRGSLDKLGDDTMAQIARVLDGGPGKQTNPT